MSEKSLIGDALTTRASVAFRVNLAFRAPCLTFDLRGQTTRMVDAALQVVSVGLDNRVTEWMLRGFNDNAGGPGGGLETDNNY